MAVEIVSLEGKHPVEEPSYEFPLTHISAYADATETVASVTWYVYDATALTNNIATTLVKASGYGSDYVYVEIRNDTTGHSYIVAGVVTSSAGRKNVVAGRFTSYNLGVALT